MDLINCPHCGKSVQIIISNAVYEEGETFICPKCRKLFRYATNR